MFGRNASTQPSNNQLAGAFGANPPTQAPTQSLFSTQSQPGTQTALSQAGGWPAAQPGPNTGSASMSPFGGNANTSSTFGTSPFGSASFSGGLRPGVTGAPGAAAGGGALSGSGSAWQAGTSGSQPLALGAAPSQGTGQVAFRPVPSSETTAHGTKQVLFDSIVFMSGFESKSFEELRFEDYQLGNRGQSGPGLRSTPTGSSCRALSGLQQVRRVRGARGSVTCRSAL
jgi:nuclear pore complex protein Nup98-Nup96